MRRRSFFIFGLALILGQGLGFCRGIYVARAVDPAVAGLGVAIALVLGWVGAGGGGDSLQLYLLRSSRFEEGESVASAHFIGAARGTLQCLIACLLAWLLLQLDVLPGTLLPVMVASLVFVLRGLRNLNVFLSMRQGRSSAASLAECTSAVVAFTTAVVCVWADLGVWIYVWIGLASAAGFSAATWIICRSIPSFRIDRGVLREFWWFSLPLVPAGLLAYANSNGEQAILAAASDGVSNENIDLSILGAYGVVLALLATPRATVGRLVSSYSIPKISLALDRGLAAVRIAANRSGLLVGLIAGGYLSVVLFFGQWGLLMVLGEKYQPGIESASLIGVYVFLNMIRGGIYQLVVAEGKTGLQLAGNTVRLAALPLIWSLVMFRSASLADVVSCLVGGEVLALSFVVALGLFRIQSLSLSVLFRMLAPGVGAAIAFSLWASAS